VETIGSKSERIQELVKEWIKSGNNYIPDELQNLMKGDVHPPIPERSQRRIIERYKDGSLTLHFHFSRIAEERGKDCVIDSVVGKSRVKDFAVAEYCVAISGNCDVREACSAPSGSEIGCTGCDQVERSVFIRVVEGVKPFKVIAPTVIRLKTLDQCMRPTSHTSELPPLGDGFSKLIETRCYGKHVPRAWLITAAQDQLADEVIQSGPYIEQEVTHDGIQIGGRLGPNADSPHEHTSILIALRSDIASAFIYQGELRHHLVEMLLCPGDLQPDAVKGMVHQDEDSSQTAR
jgi:hypothetical protein